MTTIDPEDLDPTASYKLLIGSVLPRAIAWVRKVASKQASTIRTGSVVTRSSPRFVASENAAAGSCEA